MSTIEYSWLSCLLTLFPLCTDPVILSYPKPTTHASFHKYDENSSLYMHTCANSVAKVGPTFLEISLTCIESHHGVLQGWHVVLDAYSSLSVRVHLESCGEF